MRPTAPTRTTGRYERTSALGEDVAAFVPLPLPPSDPPLAPKATLAGRLRAAERALQRLELAMAMVPAREWLVEVIVRTEAAASSRLAGAQTGLVDQFSAELHDAAAAAGPATGDGVAAVRALLEAQQMARQVLAEAPGAPISMALLCRAHACLVKVASAYPGQLRPDPSWVGGSRPSNAVLVPPPPHRLAELMSDLEAYWQSDDPQHPLIRAGLVLLQFGTIRPFADGNGRVARLLVTLLLERWTLLPEPVLGLSRFFERHRHEYHRRQNAVRLDGDWEGWLDFFLDGVATAADEAVNVARDLVALVEVDRVRLLAHDGVSVSALRLLGHLSTHPVVTVASVMTLIDATKPTAGKAIELLVEAKILLESTGKKRDRVFVYQSFLERLEVGGESVGDSYGPRRR
jgi:Fic family protein